MEKFPVFDRPLEDDEVDLGQKELTKKLENTLKSG